MSRHTDSQDGLLEKVTIYFGDRETMTESHEVTYEHTSGTRFMYEGKYLIITKGFETYTYPTDSIIGVRTEVETS